MIYIGLAPAASAMTILSHPSTSNTPARHTFFLGSYTGDSLLLEASMGDLPSSTSAAANPKPQQQEAGQEREGLAPENEDEAEETRSSKRPRLTSKEEQQALDDLALQDAEDADEALLYGLDSAVQGSAGTSTTLKARLKVLDTLVGIGPIRELVTGPAQQEQPNTVTSSTNVTSTGEQGSYVLACTGQGKSGALCTLRQTLLPDVITEVPLKGVLDAWAVHHKDGTSASEGDTHHKYLLLSFEESTTVLSSGAELQVQRNGKKN